MTNLDKGKGLDFTNISAPATSIKKDDGVVWSGTLTPAIPPQVTSITNITGQGPAGGYLPLSAFGIAPVTGVTDDSLSNFTVPTFYYGGEPYTRIGVDSNGYVVVGGGTGADNAFAPQTFPNPARPNNVVAPFWTDTNIPAGERFASGPWAEGAMSGSSSTMRRRRTSATPPRTPARSGSASTATPPEQDRQRADHDLLRCRERGQRRSRLRDQHWCGEP